MYKIILLLIFVDWIALRIFFLQLNEILKVPDSFAYLQMAANLQDLSISWFWTWWFWFLYSLPIAFVNIIVDDLFLSAQIVNIIFSWLTWIFLYLIWKRYLDEKYNIIFMWLYFLSSTLIHYSVNVLSENLYIFLFVFLIFIIHKFLDVVWFRNEVFSLWWQVYNVNNFKEIYLYTWLISFILALMYFTRSEAFIYILSIFFILFTIYLRKNINLTRFFKVGSVWLALFLLFISPYIYYLHTITWEWWLTNKWSSNLRQAQMRSIDNMDDSWFEKAVWELTLDKHHLIHWFAGWLKYDKPQGNLTFSEYIFDDFWWFLSRFINNQIKLYTKTLPWLIIKDWLKEYNNEDSIFYNNKVVLLVILLPLVLFWYGSYLFLFKRLISVASKRNFFLILSSFFFVASLFFTFFFVLERYFIVFLPFAFLVIVYWWQQLFKELDSMAVFKYILLLILLSFTSVLWTWWYFVKNSYNDTPYDLKKEAWEWISRTYDQKSLKIAERFPIVTYYSWTRERWLVPYTDKIKDLYEYLSFNWVDILVVDSMDFKKYRPMLSFLQNYEIKHKWFEVIKIFKKPWQIVILYKVKWATLKNKKLLKKSLLEKVKEKR